MMNSLIHSSFVRARDVSGPGALAGGALDPNHGLLIGDSGDLNVAPGTVNAFTVASANIQHQALALGGPVAALDAEEGRLADVVNVQTVGRSWDLWKQRVMK